MLPSQEDSLGRRGYPAEVRRRVLELPRLAGAWVMSPATSVRAGVQGISGRPRFRRLPGVVTAADRVGRQFHRDQRDELWVTDITEHRTRERKVYCAVMLEAWSRRVVGWSLNSTPSTALLTSALGMAIEQRRPKGDTIIHSDQGTQFTSWAFTRRAIDSGLLASMGSVGDCFDTQSNSRCGRRNVGRPLLRLANLEEPDPLYDWRPSLPLR